MKKFSLILLAGLYGSSLFAHNLWVKGENKDVVEANMIYGHEFPVIEEIAKDREVLFDPVKIYGQKGDLTLKQEGKFHHYKGDKKLEDGTYIVQSVYKPTAWAEKANGDWVMGKTRDQIDGEVKFCEIFSSYAKHILHVGKTDGKFATKVLGDSLEITPLSSDIKVGKGVKFKVTKDGKPLKMVEVKGSLEGYSKDELSMPFWAKTDLKGEFVFKPLQKGLWYLIVGNISKGDEKCENINNMATLTFDVK